MHKAHEGIGERGELVPGPPWILGHRGAPREAPENTLSALRRAIELGLDGVEYDLHGCASGEPVLIHDETLDRTTNASGAVADLTLPELAGVDAGGWFARGFRGEPLPLLEEALELGGPEPGRWPQHMIELKDPGLVGEVARQLTELRRPLSVRIASFQRAVCLEARDLELPTMLLTTDANEDDRRFVRDERITAYGTAPGGWRTAAGRAEWSAERWSWSVDEPVELMEACRAPFNGFNTNEPRRALAARALAFLTPHDEPPDDDDPFGGWPLHAPPLEVPAGGGTGAVAGHGEWSGRWSLELGLRNPFPFQAAIACDLAVRGGAFEYEGLPITVRLGPGETARVALRIAGGSWSPREDPTVVARYQWRRGPGRPEEGLVFDAPLARIRRLHLGGTSMRLAMLREEPGQSPASMAVRLRGRELLARVEDPGGLEDARAAVRIDSEVRSGGHGVRVPLPEDFDTRPGGVPFAIGFEGRVPGERGARRLRRWCGGLPYGLGSGATGRLHPDRSS